MRNNFIGGFDPSCRLLGKCGTSSHLHFEFTSTPPHPLACFSPSRPCYIDRHGEQTAAGCARPKFRKGGAKKRINPKTLPRILHTKSVLNFCISTIRVLTMRRHEIYTVAFFTLLVFASLLCWSVRSILESCVCVCVCVAIEGHRTIPLRSTIPTCDA